MIRKYIKRRLQGEFRANRDIVRTNKGYGIIQKRNNRIHEEMSSCFFFFSRLPSAGENSAVPVWPPSSSAEKRERPHLLFSLLPSLRFAFSILFAFSSRPPSSIDGTDAPSAVGLLPMGPSSFFLSSPFLFRNEAFSFFRIRSARSCSFFFFPFFKRIHPGSAPGAFFCFFSFFLFPAGKSLPEEGKRRAFQKRRKRRKMGRK